MSTTTIFAVFVGVTILGSSNPALARHLPTNSVAAISTNECSTLPLEQALDRYKRFTDPWDERGDFNPFFPGMDSETGHMVAIPCVNGERYRNVWGDPAEEVYPREWSFLTGEYYLKYWGFNWEPEFLTDPITPEIAYAFEVLANGWGQGGDMWNRFAEDAKRMYDRSYVNGPGYIPNAWPEMTMTQRIAFSYSPYYAPGETSSNEVEEMPPVETPSTDTRVDIDGGVLSNFDVTAYVLDTMLDTDSGINPDEERELTFRADLTVYALNSILIRERCDAPSNIIDYFNEYLGFNNNFLDYYPNAEQALRNKVEDLEGTFEEKGFSNSGELACYGRILTTLQYYIFTMSIPRGRSNLTGQSFGPDEVYYGSSLNISGATKVSKLAAQQYFGLMQDWRWQLGIR